MPKEKVFVLNEGSKIQWQGVAEKVVQHVFDPVKAGNLKARAATRFEGRFADRFSKKATESGFEFH